MPAVEDGEAGDFVVAPIPFVTPTIGYGLALGGAYLVKLDPDAPPSTIGAGVMYSENDSFAVGAGFRGYLGADRYRVTAGVGLGRLNFDLDTDNGAVPLRENIVGLQVEVLRHVGERVFVGPSLLLFGIDTDFAREGDTGSIPGDQLKADNLGLGLRALRDTRDNTFYPRSGMLADIGAKAFVPALGADFGYQVVPVSYNHYVSLGERDVLALRAAGRFALGKVPFYGQSYLGAGADLRGYAVGTVYDNVLLATQAEYRRELFWRVGAVGFAGIGTVVPDLEGLKDAVAYPSLGAGLRFTIEEKQHVNFRLDFAWGRDQSVVYLSVGEAY